MTTLMEETAEAICGGLHYSDFQFLGETPNPVVDKGALAHAIVRGELTTYWTIGASPNRVRVAVIRDEPFVRVLIEWPVLKPPRVIRGSLSLRVDCSPGFERKRVEESAGAVVKRCLEVYLDVLQKSGVADPSRPV